MVLDFVKPLPIAILAPIYLWLDAIEFYRRTWLDFLNAPARLEQVIYAFPPQQKIDIGAPGFSADDLTLNDPEE